MADPINLLLSREELMLILTMLQVETIPGLEPDPTLGEPTDEQRKLILTVAERALRARELLHTQPDGELVIHRQLLAAVGACAYPERALFVYHWEAGQEMPDRHFGYLRGEDVVLHTSPEPALHLFSLLPDHSSLLNRAVTAARYQPLGSVANYILEIPTQKFGQAREFAAAGETAKAIDHLSSEGHHSDGITMLVETLSAGPGLTVFQTLTAGHNGGAPHRQDVTLVQSKAYGWLITPTAAESGKLIVQTASQVKLLAQLDKNLHDGESQ